MNKNIKDKDIHLDELRKNAILEDKWIRVRRIYYKKNLLASFIIWPIILFSTLFSTSISIAFSQNFIHLFISILLLFIVLTIFFFLACNALQDYNSLKKAFKKEYEAWLKMRRSDYLTIRNRYEVLL